MARVGPQHHQKKKKNLHLAAFRMKEERLVFKKS
jgi:hypothetical protein